MKGIAEMSRQCTSSQWTPHVEGLGKRNQICTGKRVTDPGRSTERVERVLYEYYISTLRSYSINLPVAVLIMKFGLPDSSDSDESLYDGYSSSEDEM